MKELKVPAEMLDCGGLIGRIADYTMEQSHRPNRPLAIAGATAWVAHCMGRRYRLEDNTRPNIYLVALGWSGTGKSQPRETNKNLSRECGMMRTVIDDFRSGEALQDALLANARILSQYDEVDTLFNAIKDAKNAVAQNTGGEMLKLWELSRNYMKRRRLAKSVVRKDDDTPEAAIHPHFTLFATGVTSEVYKSFTARMASNGLVARLMFVDGGKRGAANDDVRYRDVPQSVVNDCKIIAGTTGETCAANDPASKEPPIIIQEDSDAAKARKEISVEFDAHYNTDEDGSYNAIWNRSVEKLRKVSMILAVSDCPTGPIILRKHVETAKAFVEYSNDMVLSMFDRYSAETDYEDLQKRILRELAKGITPNRKLLMALHIKGDDLREAVDTLRDAGKIIFCDKAGNELGNYQKGCCYALV